MFDLKRWLTTFSTIVFILLVIPAYAGVIYVAPEGSGDGTGWDAALNDPQAAIEMAAGSDEYSQVWIAAGTYKPLSHPNGGFRTREVHFSLRNEVSVIGGFAGTESDVSERVPGSHETVFSGDIGVQGDETDNVYHVFYHPEAAQLDASAVLDGVIISHGNANGTSNDSGGGMHNAGSSPTLINVTISGNFAVTGGGLFNHSSSATLEQVTLSDNAAVVGGGIYNVNSSPVLTNVTISGNNAEEGGGLYNYQNSTTEMINNTVAYNTAVYGAGVFNHDSSPVIKNSIFWSNQATGHGHDYVNDGTSQPVVTWSFFEYDYTDGTNIFTDDPLMLPLADNGGFTRTHAIPADSPAYALPEIAGGISWNNSPGVDQRNLPRADRGYRAMGSYEDQDLPVLGAPAFIQVPVSSETGEYTLEWGSSTTSGVIYVLQEAANDSFTQEVNVIYSGPAMSFTITDKPGGTYYYRVKATKSGFADSDWRTGANGCEVTSTEVPGAVIVDPDSGRFYENINVAAFSDNAAWIFYTYTLDGSEPQDPDTASDRIAGPAGTLITPGEAGAVNDLRIKFRGYTASGGWGPVSQVHEYTVDLTSGPSDQAAIPSYIKVPSSSMTGNYLVEWGGSSTDEVTYILEESVNSSFSRGVRTVYAGPDLQAMVTGRTNGVYYYRVKAIKEGLSDSVWRTGINGCDVAISQIELQKADMLFDWLEKQAPDILTDAPQPTLYDGGIFYRWYSETNVTIGTSDDVLYFLDQSGTLHDLGPVNFWLPRYFRDADQLFDLLENLVPDILFPAPQQSVYSDGLYYRWYSGLNVAVGIADNILYFLDMDGVLHDLGSVDMWLP